MSKRNGTAAWRWNAALLVVCLCGFVFRLVPLGRYVTPDEPAWVYRSVRFADALTAHDWTAIPITGHPGVITMWLGAVGVVVQRLLSPAESAAHLDWIRRLAWLAPENGEAFRHLAFFLSWGRVAVALTTSVGLAVLYLLVSRPFGRRVALALALLLACDPFLIGHSGLLHTDALLTTFIMLALSAALNGWLEPRRLLWWSLAGLFTGLGLLTKLSAVALLPFIVLLMAVAWLVRARYAALSGARAQHGAQHAALPWAQHGAQHAALSWAQHAAPLPVFLGCALLVVLLLYPVFWADVPAAARTLFSSAEKHVETAQHPVFFAGRMTYEPGLAFYPLVFVFRVSPVVLGGLIVGLVGLRRMQTTRRHAFVALLAFALAFSVLIEMGAKKYDRYLLPIFPPLTLAAVLGWERLGRRWPLFMPIVQLLLMLPCAPYPLAAFNPLLGGTRGAARVLEVGWGEEMGEAARWLNRLPCAGSLDVAASSVPPFASLFRGRTLPLDQATQADYVVQTLWPSRSITSSDYVLISGFVVPAAIITNTAPLELAAYLKEQAGPGDVILLDARTPLLRHYDGPATIMSLADAPDPSAILARLAALDFSPSTLWLVSDPSAAPLTRAHLRLALESIAEAEWEATVAGSTVTRYRVRQASGSMAFDYPRYRFGASPGCGLALVDALLPDAPVNASFPVYLRWQATPSNSCDFYASLYLVDAAGRPWAEVGHQVLNQVGFPTSAWSFSGEVEWADTVLVLPLPEHLLPGTYAVQLTLDDGRGAQVGGWDAGGRFRGVRVPLGEVKVAPPPVPVGPAECSGEEVLSAGPFRVCHHQVTTTPSGECHLAFIWSALERPEADYRILLRVLDEAGAMVEERIEPLSPYPTSRWRAGDSFEVRYDLRLSPELPPGSYFLVYNVLGPGEVPLWGADESLAALTVSPRAREFELPEEITCPLDLVLGGVVHLRGFDMVGYPAITVTPGEALTLTLYWQADGPTDLDYSVFVHLVGPDGQNHGQADYPAGAGIGVPSSGWVAGQVVVETVRLAVAPDAPEGSYRLAVGMYDVLSGARLPVTSASGLDVSEERAFLPVGIVVRAD